MRRQREERGWVAGMEKGEEDGRLGGIGEKLPFISIYPNIYFVF